MPGESPNPERILSFTDHLQELRVRIIICVATFFISFIIAFAFAPGAVGFLTVPLTSLQRNENHSILNLRLKTDGTLSWFIAPPIEGGKALPENTNTSTTLPIENLATNSFRIYLEGVPDPIEIGPRTRTQLSYLTPLEPFFLWLQGALLLSAVIAIPMAFYQLWLFIAPGLVLRERRIAGPLIFFALILFPIGALFAYAIMHVTLKMLLALGDSFPGLEPNLVASSYLNFVMITMLMCGLIFEFPLLLVLLSRLGIVTSTMLVEKRRLGIVIMAVIAAIATPSPDPFSMVIMLLPMLALYEGSIWAIRLLDRRRDEAIAAEEEEEAAAAARES